MANNNLRIKQINADVTFLGAAGSSAFTVGAIPTGSRITAIKALNLTANDAGTSAVIEVGTSADVDKYEDAIDVKTAAGDIATTLLVPALPAADEVIIATLTEVGTASTAGSCTIVVEYIQG